MDHLLSLSKAAKLAGISRQIIQEKIQDGYLETFEGHVRMSALAKVYPDVDPQSSAMLERVERLQNNAVNKYNPDEANDGLTLASQVRRLQVELVEVRAELESYRTLTAEIQERLTVMREGCERRERQMLQALLKWVSMQIGQYSKANR